jgi:serpin B
MWGMAYNGADGDTKTEMENAMHLNGLTAEQINASYEMLIGALQSLDEDVVFEIANAIYYANSFSVKPGFLDINRKSYDAEVSGLNFSSPTAVETINGWVAAKTHNKIQSIIDNLSPGDRMVLLNAIYFNGIWTNVFDEDGTKMRPFIKQNGEEKETPMMHREGTAEYTYNSLFKAVKLPYGNGQYNMIVMLPGAGKNSQNIIDELTSENWKDWDQQFEETEHVIVTMPRFKFAFKMNLNNLLKEMGMLQAFQPHSANFSKISDEDLYISLVRHKSFIDVNENGTEAAAVTAIVIRATSAGPDEIQKIYFTVNKPFVFAITEKDTGAILFIGEVQNPEYDE